MTKSEKFAEALFHSSLEEETKEFILQNLEKFSQKELDEIFEILKKDVKNIGNILKLTEMKFENEEKKFEKGIKELELENLKAKLGKK